MRFRDSPATMRWPRRQSPSATIPLTAGDGPLGLFWDGTQLWVACYTSGKLRRIAPSANAVQDPEITLGGKPTFPVREGIYLFVPCHADDVVRIVQVDNDFT